MENSNISSPRIGGENSFSRKQFLKVCGLSAGAAVGLSNCTEVPNAVDEEELPPLQIGPDPRPDDYIIWIGSGDVGLLNTLHIYTRLEAAFYKRVLENPYNGMTPKEEAILTALKNHEITHSDFLGALLGENAIENEDYIYFKTNTRYNFGYFDFSDKTEILQAAFAFENTGVAMYNNFPELLKRPKLFTALTKLGSVEARHAASVQFLLNPSVNFRNGVVGKNGLDTFTSPQNAWRGFNKYIWSGFDITGLPRVEFDN